MIITKKSRPKNCRKQYFIPLSDSVHLIQSPVSIKGVSYLLDDSLSIKTTIQAKPNQIFYITIYPDEKKYKRIKQMHSANKLHAFWIRGKIFDAGDGDWFLTRPNHIFIDNKPICT